VDAAWVAFSMLLAHALSPVFLGDSMSRGPIVAAVTDGVFFVVIGHAVGLYDVDVLTRRGLVIRRGLLASVLSPLATLGLFYLVLYQPIGRRVVGYAMALAAGGVVLGRVALWGMLRRRPRRVLFVGDGPLAQASIRALGEAAHHPYEVVAGSGWSGLGSGGPELLELCRAQDVDEIVLPMEGEDLGLLLPSALRCLPDGRQVRSEADFHEHVFRAVPVLHAPPAWLLGGGWDTSNHPGELVKRAADLGLALLLLTATLPLSLLAAALIALERDGPVFYTQTRLGRHGRPFQILKFRSMRVDAEATAPQWARGSDPRCTRVGRLLRRTRIDELPQLVNILRGQMSFVGPRPERPEFVSQLESAIPYYGWRHLVRPGLTGWAQIHYPYGSNVEDARHKLEFDLYYIRHRSPVLDLVILLRTVTAVARGAR
jgi:exopolysaccharide biosynthesis polyprenyl glycosylphosphotransferase